MNISPFSYTSKEFAELLFSQCGRGLQQTQALYSSFIRKGVIPKDLPSFKNAPHLFQEMVACMNVQVLPYIVVGEDDGTLRFALKTGDQHLIESVLMRMQHGLTLCVSSQIGCRMGCRFCCTGRQGLVRNLSCAEIVQQLYVARHMLKKDVKNIVFMGMGEFFDNAQAALQAVNVFSDPFGFNIGMKHITISTSGDIPGILSLAKRTGPAPNLAVSLNAASDEIRALLMPLRKNEPLIKLKQALNAYCEAAKKEVLISYVLLKDINDGLEQADALSFFLEGLPVKINIIPFNRFAQAPFEPPGEHVIAAFTQRLRENGFRTLRRGPKGTSINAACGQLQKG
jgi:23S rRNA (adenine2503-C2)-methyltransferase